MKYEAGEHLSTPCQDGGWWMRFGRLTVVDPVSGCRVRYGKRYTGRPTVRIEDEVGEE